MLAAYLKFVVAKLLIFERKVFFFRSVQYCAKLMRANFDKIRRNCAIFPRKRIFIDISMHLLFPYRSNFVPCKILLQISVGKAKFHARVYLGSEIVWNISFVGVEIKLNVLRRTIFK